MRKTLLRVAGEAAPVEVALTAATGDTCTAIVDGQRLDVEIAGGADAGHLRVHGRVVPYRVVRRGSTIHVWLRGRTWVLEVVERTARRASGVAAAGAASTLTAPMPGRILRVHVPAGGRFEAHAPIVVMESMKMEMAISVPRPGCVKEILCAEGDLVEMGALLARLEPSDGDAGPDAAAAP